MAQTLCRLLQLLVPALLAGVVNSDVFASSSQLRQLLLTEDQLVADIQWYLDAEYQRLQSLQSQLDTVLKVRQVRNIQSVQEFIGHPINAYNLIRTWSSLREVIFSENNKNEFKRRVSDVGRQFLTEKDRAGAAAAILRLQRTYNISAESLVDGNVGQVPSAPLNFGHFQELGQAALSEADYGLASDWFSCGIRYSPNPNARARAQIDLALTHFYVGDYEEASRVSREILAYDTEHVDEWIRARANWFLGNNQTMSMQAKTISKLTNWTRSVPHWRTRYEALCRGDIPQMQYTFANIKCYVKNPNNYYSWSKVEVLNDEPYISFVYDVITDTEADRLLQLASPGLSMALVGDPAKATASNDRISKVTWLWDENPQDALVPHLSRRVGMLTGLSTEFRHTRSHAEPFQVVNYGMGGQYEPHVDVYTDKASLNNVPLFIQDTGDRMATFMLYLSDVRAGGSTVFPMVDVSVPPVKNGAAFWYNIKRSGELDNKAQHAGCPVLLGEKWVANKWIREHGQEFQRPCGTSESATDETP